MQSIDSLRELNAKLLAEIGELRKKFAEIEDENGELKNENVKLLRRTPGVMLRMLNKGPE